MMNNIGGGGKGLGPYWVDDTGKVQGGDGLGFPLSKRDAILPNDLQFPPQPVLNVEPVAPNQEQRAFNLEKCAKYANDLLVKIQKTKQYRIIEKFNLRDHRGIYILDFPIPHDHSPFWIKIWDIFLGNVKSDSNSIREYNCAVKVVIRKLRFAFFGIVHKINPRSHGGPSLALLAQAKLGLDSVLVHLAVGDINPKAWTERQKRLLAEDAGCDLDDVVTKFDKFFDKDEDFQYTEKSDLLSDVEARNFYILEQARKAYDVGWKKTKAAVPETLLVRHTTEVLNKYNITNIDVAAWLMQCKENRELEDNSNKIFIDKDQYEKAKQIFLAELNKNPSFIPNVDAELFKKQIVYFGVEQQEFFLQSMNNLFQKEMGQELILAVVSYIMVNNICFSDEAKALWRKDNFNHLLLHFASSLNFSKEHKKKFLDRFDFEINRVEYGSQVDPRALVGLSSHVLEELITARKILMKEHFLEIYSKGVAKEKGEVWVASKGLVSSIELLDVSGPVKQLLTTLLIEKEDEKSLVFRKASRMVACFGLEMGVSACNISGVFLDSNDFIFSSVKALGVEDVVLRSDDRRLLTTKFLNKIDKNYIIVPPMTASGALSFLKNYIKQLYNEAKLQEIDEGLIKESIQDVILYTRLDLVKPDLAQNEVIDTWIAELKDEASFEKINGATPLSSDECVSIRAAVKEWRRGMLESPDGNKSVKIIEIVPCLFIQAFTNSGQQTVFPWCAYMSERGLEAVVKSSANKEEAKDNIAFLSQAVREKINYQTCQNKGLAIDVIELNELMQSIANYITSGKKLVLLASFQNSQFPTKSTKEVDDSISDATPSDNKKKRSRDRTKIKENTEVALRHPGLIISDGRSSKKKNKQTSAVKKGKPMEEFHKPDIPDWARCLPQNGSSVFNMTVQLIQKFAQISAVKMEKSGLLDFKKLREPPKFKPLTYLYPDKAEQYESLLPLRPYQAQTILRCKQWAKHGYNGAICLDTGLGKTRVGSELLLRKLISNPESTCLVVAPNRVKPEWKKQFEETVHRSALRCALSFYPQEKEAVKLIEHLFYFPEEDSGIKKRKKEFAQSRSEMETKMEHIIDFFPVFEEQIVEEIKRLISQEMDVTLSFLNALELKTLKQRLSDCKTCEQLKEFIRTFQTRGTIYSHTILRALKKVLPVVPEGSLSNVVEFNKYFENFPSGVITLIDTPDELQGVLENEKKGIIVCSESQISSLMRRENGSPFLKKFKPSLVILDEAHQILTQEESKDNGKLTFFGELIKCWTTANTSQIVALTATPIVNEVTDVFDLLYLLNPEKIPHNLINRFKALMYQMKEQLILRKGMIENPTGSPRKIEVQEIDEELLRGTLLQYIRLRESVIDPLIERKTWEDDEVVTVCKGQMPTKIEIKKKIVPVGEQAAEIQKILKTRNFFERSHGVERCLVHHRFYLESDNIPKLYEDFHKMSVQEKVAFISQSAFLKCLFMDQESDLTREMQSRKKALLFVKHKETAEFVKMLASAFYGLDDDHVFISHSEIKDADYKIEQFKRIQNEAAILILLPKSGGAGLNFTDVGLNIIATSEWTYEKEKQAKGRILRGNGERRIVNLRYKNPLSKHQVITTKKKELLTQLILGKRNKEVHLLIQDLLLAAETMMRSELDHVVVTPKWKEWFKGCVEKCCAGFKSSEKLIAMHSEYMLKNSQMVKELEPERTLTSTDLWGIYFSRTHGSKQHFDIIPLPAKSERKVEPIAIALQYIYGFYNPDKRYDHCRVFFRNVLGDYKKVATVGQVCQGVFNEKTQIVFQIGDTFEACKNKLREKKMNLFIYEWNEGVWGSNLVCKQTFILTDIVNAPCIQILSYRNSYSLMIPNPQKHTPLSLF